MHDAAGTGASRDYGGGDLLVRAGATALVWDERCRLTERRARTDAGERVMSYRWAEAGTLSEVVLPDGSVIEFAYDAFARRLRKEVYESEQNAAKKRGTRRQPFVPMTSEQKEAEVNRRLKAKFDDPNISIETFQSKGGNRVNPCDLCQQMFADLKISHAVLGEGGKRGKFGKYRRR